jgi:hypothetical protein
MRKLACLRRAARAGAEPSSLARAAATRAPERDRKPTHHRAGLRLAALGRRSEQAPSTHQTTSSRKPGRPPLRGDIAGWLLPPESLHKPQVPTNDLDMQIVGHEPRLVSIDTEDRGDIVQHAVGAEFVLVARHAHDKRCDIARERAPMRGIYTATYLSGLGKIFARRRGLASELGSISFAARAQGPSSVRLWPAACKCLTW